MTSPLYHVAWVALIALAIGGVLWAAVRWDLNRRHKRMVNAAKVADLAQRRAQVAAIEAKYPGNSQRQVAKRVAARKRLGRKGQALIEVVIALGAVALIVGAATGAAALAGQGYGGLALILWGCGLAVLCAALVRWAPAIETPPALDPFRDNPDGPYEGGCPIQPRLDETAEEFRARLTASRPGRK